MSTAKWVAEISSNHHQDLARCLAFVDTAAAIGCDAVKMQLFRVAELFAPEILACSAMHRARAAWELPTAFLPDIAARCHERHVQFTCAPFYLKAVDELYPHVDGYKIASYELLWNELLRACGQTGKPVVLSTGMATMPEIGEAVRVLLTAGCRDLTLLHCSSSYPAPVAECNLRAIDTIHRRWLLPVGWSDHSAQPSVLYRAVHRWKASMIEFHLDLDGSGEEYQAGHCWLPEQIGSVIATIRDGESADGDGAKVPQASELPDRDWRADPVDGLRPFQHIRSTWRPADG